MLENNFVYEIKKTINLYNKPDIILFSGKIFSNNESINQKINLKFSLEGQYFRGDRLLTNLVKKGNLTSSKQVYYKKTLWTKNKLNYPAGIAEDEVYFFL